MFINNVINYEEQLLPTTKFNQYMLFDKEEKKRLEHVSVCYICNIKRRFKDTPETVYGSGSKSYGSRLCNRWVTNMRSVTLVILIYKDNNILRCVEIKMQSEFAYIIVCRYLGFACKTCNNLEPCQYCNFP